MDPQDHWVGIQISWSSTGQLSGSMLVCGGVPTSSLKNMHPESRVSRAMSRAPHRKHQTDWMPAFEVFVRGSTERSNPPLEPKVMLQSEALA